MNANVEHSLRMLAHYYCAKDSPRKAQEGFRDRERFVNYLSNEPLCLVVPGGKAL